LIGGEGMKITYDRQVDALYIAFQEGQQVTTKEIKEGLAVDYGPDGSVAGIEILDAKETIGHLDEVLKKIVLEDIAVATA
jgi:uncharacterized protein YuzE